jgi:hypothetical protein
VPPLTCTTTAPGRRFATLAELDSGAALMVAEAYCREVAQSAATGA